MIEISNLNYIYNPSTPYETHALKDINLKISEGEFIGVIGHTGSGKSTFLQHLNGLIRPTSGKILVDGLDITQKDAKLIDVRQKVGLVFQYPEHQLFEENIYKDIGFGPKNLELSEEEVHRRILKSMDLVGLDYETMKDVSPFDLSGGQKRRVAIAGVLAMEPKYLVLDEPTAGLDPQGREEILGEIKKLHEKENLTIILVSHSMEDIARLADRVLVFHKGELKIDDGTREVFSREEELESMGLGIPEITRFMRRYKEKGHQVSGDVLTIEEAKEEILKYLRSQKND